MRRMSDKQFATRSIALPKIQAISPGFGRPSYQEPEPEAQPEAQPETQPDLL